MDLDKGKITMKSLSEDVRRIQVFARPFRHFVVILGGDLQSWEM